MHRVDLYGINIFSKNKEVLMEEVDERLNNKEKLMIMSVNPEILLNASKDDSVDRVLKKAQINLPDGTGILLLAKKANKKIEERIPGFDVFKKLCEKASKEKKRIFMYGAKEENIKKAVTNLKEEFPDLVIAGWENGFTAERGRVVEKINEVKTDFLFVALGSPHQEEFIDKYIDVLNIKIVQPVGGSFDVVAGVAKRAPKFIQKAGLEWLYRLARDPKRIKRIIKMLFFTLMKILDRGKPG